MFKRQKYVYHFNPQTLSYEKESSTLGSRLKRISTTLLFGLVFGVVISVVVFRLFPSPHEKALKREIKQYEHQLKMLNERLDIDDAVLADLESRDSSVYRTIFGASPIRRDVRKPNDKDYEYLKAYQCGKEIIRTSRRIDTLTQRLYAQSLSIDEVHKMTGSKQERMLAMPAILPIPKDKCQLVSGFGMRFHPILHYRRMHTGIDLTAKAGTPVYATANGTVAVSGRGEETGGYGICVIIDHGYGYKTLYGHLSSTHVSQGQKVKRGEMIGRVGCTGLSQGNHLHYEVIHNDTKVNPIYFLFNDLSPKEYEKVLEAANQENQCLS